MFLFDDAIMSRAEVNMARDHTESRVILLAYLLTAVQFNTSSPQGDCYSGNHGTPIYPQ